MKYLFVMICLFYVILVIVILIFLMMLVLDILWNCGLYFFIFIFFNMGILLVCFIRLLNLFIILILFLLWRVLVGLFYELHKLISCKLWVVLDYLGSDWDEFFWVFNTFVRLFLFRLLKLLLIWHFTQHRFKFHQNLCYLTHL